MAEVARENDPGLLDDIDFNDEMIQAILRGEDIDPESANKSEANKSVDQSNPNSRIRGDTTQICQDCGTQNCSRMFHEHFGLHVCFDCLRGEKYRLASKSTLKRDFLLTDEEIDTYLPCITKVNPNHPTWSAMKLYLRSAAKDVALARFGSEQELENEKRRRESAKFDNALKRTRQKREEEELKKRVQLELERRYLERGESLEGLDDAAKTSALILSMQVKREKQRLKKHQQKQVDKDDDDDYDSHNNETKSQQTHQRGDQSGDEAGEEGSEQRPARKAKATSSRKSERARVSRASPSSKPRRAASQDADGILGSDAARLREAASRVHIHNYVVPEGRVGVKVCTICNVEIEYEEL